MSPGKRKSSEDRRADILSATLDLAFEVGPDHVTTGMIARRLGLTQPAIYKHFPNKEHIWQAATEAVCAQIGENARQGIQPGQTPVDVLRGLVLGHLSLIAAIPALPEIMVTRDPSGRLSETRRAILAEITVFRTAMARWFELAQAAGQIRTELRPDDGGMLLFGIIQSLVLRLIVTRDATMLVDDGARLLDLQFSLFTHKGHDA